MVGGRCGTTQELSLMSSSSEGLQRNKRKFTIRTPAMARTHSVEHHAGSMYEAVTIISRHQRNHAYELDRTSLRSLRTKVSPGEIASIVEYAAIITTRSSRTWLHGYLGAVNGNAVHRTSLSWHHRKQGLRRRVQDTDGTGIDAK